MNPRRLLIFCMLVLIFNPASAQNYCKLGETKWIDGCAAQCTDSWEGGNCPQSCNSVPPPGYVILNYRDHDLSTNNGGFNVTRVAANQVFRYKRDVTQAYNTAFNAAGKAGKKAAAASIKQDMNSAIHEAESLESTHQMIRLSVYASKHGSIFDKKRGWSHHKIDIEVKCVVPQNLTQQLYKKYALK